MDVDPLADAEIAEPLDNVNLAQLSAGERMSIQHFRIEPGGRVEEHSHHHEQAGFLFSGEVVFIADGEEHTIHPNTSYVIPGDEPHAAENRGDEPAVGIEIFSPPRLNPPWLD